MADTTLEMGLHSEAEDMYAYTPRSAAGALYTHSEESSDISEGSESSQATDSSHSPSIKSYNADDESAASEDSAAFKKCHSEKKCSSLPQSLPGMYRTSKSSKSSKSSRSSTKTTRRHSTGEWTRYTAGGQKPEARRASWSAGRPATEVEGLDRSIDRVTDITTTAMAYQYGSYMPCIELPSYSEMCSLYPEAMAVGSESPREASATTSTSPSSGSDSQSPASYRGAGCFDSPTAQARRSVDIFSDYSHSYAASSLQYESSLVSPSAYVGAGCFQDCSAGEGEEGEGKVPGSESSQSWLQHREEVLGCAHGTPVRHASKGGKWKKQLAAAPGGDGRSRKVQFAHAAGSSGVECGGSASSACSHLRESPKAFATSVLQAIRLRFRAS